MEADWETCKRGHDLLYMTFECVSCYFHGKPAYSEDPLKLAASKEQVMVHYREVHEKTRNDVTEEVIEDKKGDSDIVELTLEKVELFSNSIPKPVLESVTEDEAIVEIGKKYMVGELTRAEYEIWSASEEKKRRSLGLPCYTSTTGWIIGLPYISGMVRCWALEKKTLDLNRGELALEISISCTTTHNLRVLKHLA